MGILKALRIGPRIADKVTRDAQAVITLYRYLGSSATGAKSYGPAITMRALVDWRQKQVRTLQGTLSVSRAQVTFLNITALVLATDGEGIDDNDRIVLPDGTTGPILDMAGFIDANTGIPLATEVYLG